MPAPIGTDAADAVRIQLTISRATAAWLTKSPDRSPSANDVRAALDGYRSLLTPAQQRLAEALNPSEINWLRYSLSSTFWDATSLPCLWSEAKEALGYAVSDNALPEGLDAIGLRVKIDRMGQLEAWAFYECYLRRKSD